MRIKTIEDIANSNLPTAVIMDINQRITDWLASGGSINDEYVKRQFEYADRVQQLIECKNFSKAENMMKEWCDSENN